MIGGVFETRVCRVRTEEQGVARLRKYRDRIFLVKLGRCGVAIVRVVVVVIAEVDPPPVRTCRDEHERTAVLCHLVDGDQRLHVTAGAVDVVPGPGALVAVLYVLVPVERDAVVRALEMRLAKQLIHATAAEELRRRHH